MKCLSLLSLKVSTRWGFRLCRCQIRRTVASLNPWDLAIVRVLQCVAFGGVACKVALTTFCTLSSGIWGRRPGRGASFSSPASRSAKNLSLQSWTVGREMPIVVAMSRFIAPSAAMRIILARSTVLMERLRWRDQISNVLRSWGDRVIGSAILLIENRLQEKGIKSSYL